ncbi:MAG: ABC transporter permease subunit [Alphaproteobacteria bacterium]|jgi:putative spermidine/putrescine transport system permease protein|nr:ABC transporter permease subunit [Alphaproteobacteria bacterium]
MTDTTGGRKPAAWRLMDGVDRAVAALWPKRLHGLTGWLFLLPALALVFVLVIGLAVVIEFSLHELDITTYRLKEEYSLANYLQILERTVYLRILGRSLLAALIVTAITLVLALPYAYLMVRTASAGLRKFLLVALFLPFFIGQVVRAYGWLIILGKEGLLNSLLTAIGLPALDLIYNYGAVVFGLVQYMLPFAVLLITPAIAAIPEDVELASESLGAGWVRTFRHVVLPMAVPGLVGAAVVVFTLTLTDFAMPEILGGGTSDFIANAIYDSYFQISDPGLGSALSVVLVGVGSAIVALAFVVAGTGTLGLVGRRE